MGNPKQKWTSEEEEALRAGVAKHGPGKWKNIQRDAEFCHLLSARSNIDLKDKWRNLSVANGQGSRDKQKAPKTKVYPVEAPATSLPVAKTSAYQSYQHAAPSYQDVVMLDSEGSNVAKFNAMIFKALSTLKQPNGSDCVAIATFIEQRQEVPHNFKRVLSSSLRKLVQQDKLEKVQNCFRIKSKAQLDTSSPVITRRELQPRQVPSYDHLGNTIKEAAEFAAYIVAEAHNKSFVAAEAVKEEERIAKMDEETEAFLQFAQDCFDISAQGEIVLKA